MRRQRWLIAVNLSQPPDFEQLPSRGASPEEQALLRSLFATLDTLPVDDRIAWSLRHIQGETLPEIARLVGCSLATVKRRIQRAQNRLKEAA